MLTHLARPFLPSSLLPSVALLHLNNKFLFFVFQVSSLSLGFLPPRGTNSGDLPYVELPISVQVSFMEGLRICLYLFYIISLKYIMLIVEIKA